MAENFLEYLKNRKFDKRIKELSKKYKGKKVVLYGTGQLFECIRENYDLGQLNIIGVCDRKFEGCKPETYANYPTIKPSELKNSNTDVVLTSVVYTVPVVEDLRYNLLDGSNIKVLPFVKKKFAEIVKEIWS